MALPLHQQLQATGQQAQTLVPHLERLLCFAVPERGGGACRLLFDSQAESGVTPVGEAGAAGAAAGAAVGAAAERWCDPLDHLRQQGAVAVHSVARPGYLIVFLGRAGRNFAPAEEAVLAAFAELLASSLEQAAGDALQMLRLATQVAHDFARLRDFETGNHLERVSGITRLIAEGLAADAGLENSFIEQISLFSRLHDIGKIGIPDAILLKPGRLDDEEMAVMRTHVQKGLEILDKVLDQHGIARQAATELMANVIRCHHERLDGSGYPAGLRAEQIPLEGRIVAVADVFDAVTSTRPYRRSATVTEGLTLVRQLADEGQLDPSCVAALEARRDVLQRIVEEFRDLPQLAIADEQKPAIEANRLSLSSAARPPLRR